MNTVKNIYSIKEYLLDCKSFNSKFKEKIIEKNDEQLDYIVSPIDENVYLSACAGSGKTEVVAMKATYEISKWNSLGGIAILTFTNEATDTITSRIKQYSDIKSFYPHYVGTLTSFINGYITQKFANHHIEFKKNTQSYSVIDKDLKPYNNPWIKSYKAPFSYITKKKKRLDIYAHQIYYDPKIKDFVIYLPNFKTKTTISFKEYYYSDSFQEYLKNLRQESKKDWLFKEDYLLDELKKLKKRFYKDGFANFEDLNSIAYSTLNNNLEISSRLAKRFPLILVDECQDLSWIEIEILKSLSVNGSKLHFIGDLNQAIYEFKNATPNDTLKLISNFKLLRLTQNYRSCQTIVNTTNKIASLPLSLQGNAEDIFKENSILYIEYSSLDMLKNTYNSVLEKLRITTNQAAILVRSKKLKEELKKENDIHNHYLIMALQLWHTNVPSDQIRALTYTGYFISKYFGSGINQKNYHCPKEITSVYQWRLFLKDFLNICSQYPALMNFKTVKYGEWYKDYRETHLNIINKAYMSLKNFDEIKDRNFDTVKVITPKGTTKLPVEISKNLSSNTQPQVLTIHASKGCEFDSVMVVSNNDIKSSGFWKNWIEEEGETRRIGYVANSRAKYSLVWAIPTLQPEEKILLESLGFKNYLDLVNKA